MTSHAAFFTIGGSRPASLSRRAKRSPGLHSGLAIISEEGAATEERMASTKPARPSFDKTKTSSTSRHFLRCAGQARVLLRAGFGDCPSSTLVHLSNAVVASIVLGGCAASLVRSDTPAALACLLLGQAGLVYNHAVVGAGRFLGEGELLRYLNKGRFVWHATSIPLLAILTLEIAAGAGLLTREGLGWGKAILVAVSLAECWSWTRHCSPADLKPVDLRRSKKHRATYLPGTLVYTSGKVLPLVLPVVAMVLLEVVVGLRILLLGDGESPAAARVLAWNGGLAWVTCGLGPLYPALQLWGENLHGLLLWRALLLMA